VLSISIFVWSTSGCRAFIFAPARRVSVSVCSRCAWCLVGHCGGAVLLPFLARVANAVSRSIASYLQTNLFFLAIVPLYRLSHRTRGAAACWAGPTHDVNSRLLSSRPLPRH